MTADPPTTLVQCVDYWAGQAAGGVFSYTVGLYGPNTARIRAAFAIPMGTESNLPGNTEVLFGQVFITHAKSVGTGSCAGCSTPACLTLSSIKVVSNSGSSFTSVILSGGASAPGSDSITWQGGAGVSSQLGSSCPSATPTQNRTWGQVKSLYR